MKKIAQALSVSSALAVLLSASFSAQAAEYASTSTYTQSIQLERYALTAEEAASGETAIHAGVYLKGYTGSSIGISSAQCKLLPDESGYTYFRNMTCPTDTYEEAVYEYLGGSFTTSYRPFCFGIVEDGAYRTKTFDAQIRDYCSNPTTGSPIYYNGNDTITFKLHGRYYVNEAGELAPDSQTHNIVCPLTLHDDGSATYTYQFADIYTDRTEVATAVGEIPYYQPELLNVGDKIPSSNNMCSWIAGAGTTASFLGNSDDFPLVENDLYLKPGTPCGIYNIKFDQTYSSVNVKENDKNRYLPVKYEEAAVAVGVESASGTSITAPEYVCYYAENNKMITANSMNAAYECDVAFTDGTQQQLDVTNAVNAGTTPKELYEGSEQNYYMGDVSMYCGDTAITDENGEEVKQTVLVGLKGDVNMDGEVNVADATAVLTYYAQYGASLEPTLTDGTSERIEALAFFLADTDTQSQTQGEGGQLTVSDATNILTYYASVGASLNISWDQFI
ncbi:MAG: hypothetical protein IJ496_08990 [Ruminococcus sp.]|nr:hypothetical protein [Ruminococcus sp.]